MKINQQQYMRHTRTLASLLLLILLLILNSGAAYGQSAEKWIKKALKTKDPELRVKYCLKAVEAEPLSSRCHLFYGRSLYETGQIVPAIKQYNEAILLDSENHFAFYLRGHSEYNLGQFEASLADFEVAVRLDRGNALYMNWRGLLHYRLGQLQAAIRDFGRVLEMSPDNAYAYQVRGMVNNDLGLVKKAYQDYSKAIEFDPGDKENYLLRGKLLHTMDLKAEATEDLNAAILLDPDHVPSLEERASVYYHRRMYSEALSDITKAVKLAPENYWIHNDMGNILYEMGRYEESAEAYSKSISLDSSLGTAWSNRGNAKDKLGLQYEARKDFETSLRLNPDDMMTHNNYGTLNRHMGFLKDAIACHRKAAELVPEIAASWSDISYTNLMLGKYEAAIQFADSCIARGSEKTDAYPFNNRGSAKMWLGQYKEAICDFDTSLILKNPYRHWVLASRGNARERMGDLEGAARDYRLALEARPGYERAQAYLAELESVMAAGGNEDIRSRTWIVSVGMGKHQNADAFPDREGRQHNQKVFDDFWVGQRKTPEERVISLSNEKASREQILNSLKATFNDTSQVRPQDIVVFYFSGYGVFGEDRFGICAYDCDGEGGIITEREILDIMEASPAKRKLCLVDACVPDSTADLPLVSAPLESPVAFLRSGDLYASDTGLEYGRSWFSFLMVAGLRRVADVEFGGLVTLQELHDFISNAFNQQNGKARAPQINPGADRSMVVVPVD